MVNTKINLEKSADKTIVHIEGSVDENFSQFSQAILDGGKLEFSLEKLKSINSTGIREWIKLMQRLTKSEITFTHCPKIFIDQLNMVSGFIPKNSKIISFYVPYYNEDLDQEVRVLFTAGKEFNGSKVTVNETYKNDKGQEFELDIIKAKYFKFLDSLPG